MAKKTKAQMLAQEKPMTGEAEAEFVRDDENLKLDQLSIEKEDLPLRDEVITDSDELPDDEVESDFSLYDEDEDIEVITPTQPDMEDPTKEWVSNPALLVKVEGYKDTLNGTLYFGTPK